MYVCKIRESKASSALRVMHPRSTLMSSGLGVDSSVMERGRMSTEGGPSPPPLFVFHPVYVFVMCLSTLEKVKQEESDDI